VLRRMVVLLGLGLIATACGSGPGNTAADRATPPEVGSCWDLAARDLDQPSNASPAVPCTKAHTAQTFAVGALPASTGSSYQDRRHGSFVFDTCTPAFRAFIAADESLAMRSQLSWVWFRPSQRGWDRGARWYRCDVVGGPDGATKLRDLPAVVKGLFATELPDAWLTCARGTTFARSTKVPCSEAHDWRAVTTIKVGQPQDPYPGDRIVEVRSRDRCSDWIGAWLHYPADFDYGYTWFHQAEWKAGNRRSVCWERTSR
jgi:Septum formation